MQKKEEKKAERMDSVRLKQIPKFSREKKYFPVWFTKATAVCALNGVSPTLKARFKDMLPANDAIPLDKTKPNEFQFIVNKNANLIAMNLLTVMLCDTDAMIMLIDSTKTRDWLDGLVWKLIEKLCKKFKPDDTIASAEQLEKLMKLTLKKNQDPECENIQSWILYVSDSVFSHQGDIYGFKFPDRFLEISSRGLTLS